MLASSLWAVVPWVVLFSLPGLLVNQCLIFSTSHLLHYMGEQIFSLVSVQFCNLSITEEVLHFFCLVIYRVGGFWR